VENSITPLQLQSGERKKESIVRLTDRVFVRLEVPALAMSRIPNYLDDKKTIHRQ
jgi:hypothetical protein